MLAFTKNARREYTLCIVYVVANTGRRFAWWMASEGEMGADICAYKNRCQDGKAAQGIGTDLFAWACLEYEIRQAIQYGW